LAFPFRAEGAIIEPPKRGGVEMNLKLIGKLGGLLAALIILVLAGGNQEQKGLAQARPQDGQLPLLTALQSFCDEEEKERWGFVRPECIFFNLRDFLSSDREENDFIPFIYWGLWRALHGYRDTDLDAVFYQALHEVGDYRSIEQAVRTWERLDLWIKDAFFTRPFAELGHNGSWPTSPHALSIPFTIEGFVKIVSQSFLWLAVGTPVTDQFADLGVIFQGAHRGPAYIVNDGVKVTMKLRMLKCVKETFELSGSDEIYLVITRSIWRESQKASKPLPHLVIPEEGYYDDVDSGEERQINQIIAEESLESYYDFLAVFIALMEKDSKGPVSIVGAAVGGAIGAAIGLITGGAPALIALGALGGAISAVIAAFTDILQDDDLLGIGYLAAFNDGLDQGYLTPQGIIARGRDFGDGVIRYVDGYDYRLEYSASAH
jgi:hypothetical protein